MKNYIFAFSMFFKTNKYYKFKFNDALLYFFEKNQKVEKLKLLDMGVYDSLYQIKNVYFYWNNKFSSNDLPWLYNEIFSPYESNPSSYSNLRVLNSTTNWVIDAGACEGFFSLLAIQKNIKNIIAIEPIKELSETLAKTFDHNNN